MLANMTWRTRVLLAMAVGVAGYIAFTPDDSQTIEPARAGGSTHPQKAKVRDAAPSGLAGALKNLSGRIVTATSAASLFSPHSWYVAPPPPPPAPVVAAPPPVPTAPPLPFAYMGSYRTDGGKQVFFLTAGDRVFDVKVGDVLDSTYSVDGIQSGQLTLTYLPLKIQQTLAVGDEQ
jgi:hypothetical protein